jgi:hypothetical protein
MDNFYHHQGSNRLSEDFRFGWSFDPHNKMFHCIGFWLSGSDDIQKNDLLSVSFCLKGIEFIKFTICSTPLMEEYLLDTVVPK